HPELQVILQVRADTGQLGDRRDAGFAQARAGADAGALQDLRRPDRTRRQDDLTVTKCALALSVDPANAIFDSFDAPGSVGATDQSGDLGVSHHFQVGPSQHGPQERLRRIPAYAAPLVHVEVAAAEIVAAVEIVARRNPGFRGRLAERIEDLPGHPRALDPPFATVAV